MPRLFLIALALLSSSLALAAEPVIQSSRAALAQDAAVYAAKHRLPQAEALSRLAAIEESHATTDAIARRFEARLAGISVRHTPTFGIVVLLTGDNPVRADRFVASDKRVVPIEFRTGALATRRQLVLAIRTHQDELRKTFSQSRGIGVDPRRGTLRLYLGSPPDDPAARQALEAKASALTGVPVTISPADSRVFDFSVAGGGRVIGAEGGKRFACTTGFLVTDGTDRAVTTAAHCPDEMTYYEPDGTTVALPYISQWGARAYDVQLNRIDGPQPPARFYADRKAGVLRPVISWRGRASIRAGDFLCHWGEKSGYACAEVELTDYAPPFDLCAGPCEPLFTTLAGPQCGAGDSGGPIFIGALAIGLIKGGSKGDGGASCNFSYFQSVDYLPPGWRLLTAQDRLASGTMGTVVSR